MDLTGLLKKQKFLFFIFSLMRCKSEKGRRRKEIEVVKEEEKRMDMENMSLAWCKSMKGLREGKESR
jgi:hypothetical protein